MSSTLDPYVNSYNGHDGEVTIIDFSPHRKELFLTCGTDDQIKIFHVDQVIECCIFQNSYIN